MKLCHVTIQTEQFETELNFYLRYAGLTVQRDLRPMGRTMVFLADTAGDTEIEIIEKPNASNAGNANLSIGFIADNADEIRRQLAALDAHGRGGEKRGELHAVLERPFH